MSTSKTDQWCYGCLTSSCKVSMEVSTSLGATLLRSDKHGSCNYRKKERRGGKKQIRRRGNGRGREKGGGEIDGRGSDIWNTHIGMISCTQSGASLP